MLLLTHEKFYNASIDRRKKRYEYTKLINLPNLIFNHNNIFYFHEPDSAPNYITQKNVTADIVVIKSNRTAKNIDKKIVFIENADPDTIGFYLIILLAW